MRLHGASIIRWLGRKCFHVSNYWILSKFCLRAQRGGGGGWRCVLTNPSYNARIQRSSLREERKSSCINIYDSSILFRIYFEFISKSSLSVVEKENEESRNLSSTTVVLKRRKTTTKRDVWIDYNERRR